MATRYQTYQTSYGWCTIDTHPSSGDVPPSDYISGPFDVNLTEADQIMNGAEIALNNAGTDVIVTVE